LVMVASCTSSIAPSIKMPQPCLCAHRAGPARRAAPNGFSRAGHPPRDCGPCEPGFVTATRRSMVSVDLLALVGEGRRVRLAGAR
jgi:hypothetical protein